jgi:RimJ/RimL family protein N-acetyltransferase
MNNANTVLITIYAKVIFLFFLALNFNQDVFSHARQNMPITKSIQIKPDVITTSRLILRSAIQGDGEKLFDRYCGDAACSRFLMRGRHISVAQTENFLDRWCGKAWEDGGSFAWVIAEKIRNEPIGVFTVIIRDHHAEFHFGISKSHWGQGLVIEAGLAVIAWLETTGWRQERVISIIALICSQSRRALPVTGTISCPSDNASPACQIPILARIVPNSRNAGSSCGCLAANSAVSS